MRLIDASDRSTGKHQSPELTLNERTIAIAVSMPRRTQTDALMFADLDALAGVDVWISYDDGKVWGPLGGFASYGGVHIRRDGTVAAESKMLIRVPPGRNRRLMVELATDKRARLACDVEEILAPDTGRLMLAIAYDSGDFTSSAANVTSLTTAAFTIAGSDRILMGGIGSGAGTPVDPSGMKWGGSGGVALTQRGSTVNVGAFVKVSQFSLVAPAASSDTLYGSWPGNQDETVIGGASYTGVDQTVPHGTQATASGSLAAVSTVNVSSASGEVVADVTMFLDLGGNLNTLTEGALQTPRVDIAQVGGAAYEAFGMSDEPGDATITMSWTVNTGTCDWGILGIPLKPASGVAPTRVSSLLRMGI